MILEVAFSRLIGRHSPGVLLGRGMIDARLSEGGMSNWLITVVLIASRNAEKIVVFWHAASTRRAEMPSGPFAARALDFRSAWSSSLGVKQGLLWHLWWSVVSVCWRVALALGVRPMSSELEMDANLLAMESHSWEAGSVCGIHWRPRLLSRGSSWRIKVQRLRPETSFAASFATLRWCLCFALVNRCLNAWESA